MKKTLRFAAAAVIAGSALLATSSVQAFWGPFDWFDNDDYYGGPWGGGPWGGGPWGGHPGYGYGGYPGYGYGGYPGYGYGGYPGYGYGGYPYAAPAPAAPAAAE
ncbi:MAG: hypothetical protein JMN27_01450 [gamma proteobacterium endosymbiont of Lamellibrachia anaximandri]|nr:hypothetical protein [gamma proteobacterium endosymbiont of Lamellibrachia anaximandri]MBL3532483.1 hypothetical protein [gamma proteobacterium endosymbiont of Lamellibrachia anaximandri]